MVYTIYQLDFSKDSVKNNPHKAFAGWDETTNDYGRVNIEDYKVVYEGETNLDEKLDDIDILENLFSKFNMRRPEDFLGHSLSVSDIVSLNGVLYYCDNFGWKEIV